MILIGLGLLAIAILAYLAYRKFTSTVNSLKSPWLQVQNLFS